MSRKLDEVGRKKRGQLDEVGYKKRAGFEADPHYEAMLQEQRETPRAFEWRHSLTEKRELEAYAEAKRRTARVRGD